jgi:hypothetical protein
MQLIPDCCQAFLVGVATAALADFRLYERACDHRPMCKCLGPTIADDGRSGNIAVTCAAQRCMTYVP